MTIDWVTLVAQIINFLILIYILKRFLYGPIIKAMDEREEKIAVRLEKAREQEEKALEKEREYIKKTRDFQDNKDRMLKNAEHEVDEEKYKLLDQARTDVERQKHDWEDALVRQREAFLDEVQKHSAFFTYEVMEHALGDLADENLERKMVDSFARHIGTLDPEYKSELSSKIMETKQALKVRSAYQLTPDERDIIEQALYSNINKDIKVNYDVEPNLISGIELRFPGYKISWNIENYLEDLKNNLTREIEKHEIARH
jgi:F-type H+-transporting ATPase subunit b